MGTLDQVTKMKNQGLPDDEIATKLQEQKISPKEINDAMDQSKIKNAVSDTEGMQPSIMNAPKPTREGGDTYTPQTREYEQDTYTPQPEDQQEEYTPQPSYDEYPSLTGTDTDTMIEIAEQVFSEKMQKIQKQLEKLNEFQTLSQVKIDSTAERLKRIETIIDNLQISILDRVGSYGKNLNNLKKEMAMVQDSFKKIPKHKIHKTTKKHSKK